MNLLRASARAGLSGSISRAFRPTANLPSASFFRSSDRSFKSLPQNAQATFSGCTESYRSNASCGGNNQFLILGNLSQKMDSLKLKQALSLPCALTFRCFIHSGDAKNVDRRGFSGSDAGSISKPDTGSFSIPDRGNVSTPDRENVPRLAPFLWGISGDSGIGGTERSARPPFSGADTGRISVPDRGSIPRRADFPREISRESGIGSSHSPYSGADTGSSSRRTDYVRGLIEESGIGGFPPSAHTADQNADILHIKMLRNNTFVTLTDSKGNKKRGELSASAGSLPDKGGKVSRYGAEATAEHVGREAKSAGIKSVVVKVDGFTFFKKKRQAIMAFREGYTHGRGDQTPIIHIEDTTRRPHNGCRRPKKRRI